MGRVIWAMLLLGALGPGSSPDAPAEDWKRGYSIGYQVGEDFRRQNLEISIDHLLEGVRDAMAGSEPRMTREEMDRALALLQGRAAAASERVRDEGKAFLAANEGRPGVTSLPSGLQYVILEQGHGERPGPGDTVTIHYRGTLIDGSEFDSSLGRGQPATFTIGSAIPAWNEALPLMTEGSRWRLFVPPRLGYGERAPARVGPDRTVIFEIELLSVD